MIKCLTPEAILEFVTRLPAGIVKAADDTIIIAAKVGPVVWKWDVARELFCVV